VSECAAQQDDAARLACYDRLFRDPARNAPITPPATGAPPVEGAGVAPRTLGASTGPAGSPLTTYWELRRADKRGTFVVRTHLPNYLLPLHVTSRINRTPSSPSRPAVPSTREHRRIEAKLQVSLRAKVVEGLLLPDADLWFAYTQRSLWQVWNRRDSSPFRSTDYQPEAIYLVPVPERLGALPGGWHLRFAETGLAHQSNGQSEPLSRSWNRFYVGAALERGEFGLHVRVDRRFEESSEDDNPDLTDYIGNMEVRASWLPGLATATLSWRLNPDSLRRGSLQLDWTYPVQRDQPAGLRWYGQLFTGYGETLLDYNVRQTSVGLGLTLFQF
jgi:phospholipase A1